MTDGVESNDLDNNNKQIIPDLIVRLLKGCDEVQVGWNFITTSNYQMFLRRIFRQKCHQYNIENPFNADTDFHSLPLKIKLKILHYLCEFRLDSESVTRTLDNLEADSLRIEPLGFDGNDSAYWYFYGTRLYREDYISSVEKKKRYKNNTQNQSQSIWQVVCFTEDDWNNLVSKFKSSKNKKERALCDILQENFLPNIPKLFKDKELQRRRKLFQARTSSRIKALADRKETRESRESSLESNNKTRKRRLSEDEEELVEQKEVQQIRRDQARRDRQIRAEKRYVFVFLMLISILISYLIEYYLLQIKRYSY